MHTVGLFNSIAAASGAADALKERGIPSEVATEHAANSEDLIVLSTNDAEAVDAMAELDKLSPSGRLICPKCGSGDLDFPGTPNHTFLSRAIGNLAVKSHLVEKQILCEDCRHEWLPS